MKIIITLIIIVLLLLYLSRNKIIIKKIGYKSNYLEHFNVEDYCPTLPDNIINSFQKKEEDTYLCIIPNSQPFNDYDSVSMIVETQNFIFALNENMSQIERADKTDGIFINVSNKLIKKIKDDKEDDEDTNNYIIPFIGACYKTDECFAYVKTYTQDDLTVVDQSGTNFYNFEGELWKVDGTESKKILNSMVSVGGSQKNLDLIGKIHIESKKIENTNHYNIYAILREKTDLSTINRSIGMTGKNIKVYKNRLVNFHGNDNEGNYFGSINSENSNYLGSNVSYITEVIDIDIDIGTSLTIWSVVYNDNFNLNKILEEYEKMEGYIDEEYYDEIHNWNENTLTFFTRFFNTDNNNYKIKNTLDFYNNVITGSYNTDTLDEIKKQKYIEYGKEILQILNEYKRLNVNDGLNLGVFNFNVTANDILVEHFEKQTYSTGEFNYNIFDLNIIKQKIDDKSDMISQTKSTYDSTTKNIYYDFNDYRASVDQRLDMEEFYLRDNIVLSHIDTNNRLLETNLDVIVASATTNSLVEIVEKKYLFSYKDSKDISDYYTIKVGCISGTKNVYGILKFNYTNFKRDNDEINNKDILDKLKRTVYFQLYLKQNETENIAPVNIIFEHKLDYELNPSIKFDHQGMSLYNWFLEAEAAKEFQNRKEWYEIYDLMKREGIYYPNPEEGFNINNMNFPKILNYIKDSALEDSYIKNNNLFNNSILVKLAKMKDTEIYNNTLDDNYPQLHIYKDFIGDDERDCFIYINFFPDDQNKNELYKSDQQGNELELHFIGLDLEPIEISNKIVRVRSKYFKDEKYINKDDDNKTKYHILIKENKDVLMRMSNENEKKKYIWKKQEIKNFKEYFDLLTNNVKVNDNSRDRVRGLYEIDEKFMDKEYLDYLQNKKANNQDLDQIDLVIAKAEKNIQKYNRMKLNQDENEDDDEKIYSGAHAYPFFVIYKTVDYFGNPCDEGIKNTQKLFLTTKIKEDNIIDENNEVTGDYTNMKNYPFIKEEYISFTGFGNDIQFYGRKIGGSTNIQPKQFCNYPSIPDDKCVSDTCTPKKLGLIRIDGSPKCQILDDSVKTKSETPNQVEMIGNVSENACDLFKLKGNKKLYYRLGRIFKHGRDGKYQIKNTYTLQQTYDKKYFSFYDNKVVLVNKLDESKIDNYTFIGEPKKDNYGMYYIFKAFNTNKYLTRKINIFDREFEDWTLEDLKDVIGQQRNIENENSGLYINDNDYYSQKFAIPKELIMNMVTQDGTNDSITNEIQNNFINEEALRCQNSPELCEGDKNFKVELSPAEEKKLLNKQLDDIRGMMNQLNAIPPSFYEPPNMVGLRNKINQLKQIIPAIEINIIKSIKLLDFKFEYEEAVKEQKQILLKRKSNPLQINEQNNNILYNNMNNTKQKNFLSKAMESIQNTFNQRKEPKCYSLENFSNVHDGISDYHISKKYSDYIEGKLSLTREQIDEMNKTVSDNLAQIKNLSQLQNNNSGDIKGLLLSEKIKQDNNLDKDIFKIKNIEQQSRITNILKKLDKIENLRNEMNEDDFKTNKPDNEHQYHTLISKNDNEHMNIYKIESNELGPSMSDNNNLLFLNDGCISYNNLDINTQHCMIGNTNQMFQIHRIEDLDDMNKYNIKNAENGITKPYSIIKSNDDKCLHKEDKELSFRKCDNIDNQQWQYSKISGCDS